MFNKEDREDTNGAYSGKVSQFSKLPKGQRRVALGSLGLTTGYSVLSLFNPEAAWAINQIFQAFFMATGGQ